MHTRTCDLPPVELTDPVWTVEHLALALRQGERATRTLVTEPAFPAGFRLNDAPTARRYWLRQQVLDHFASLSVAPATRRTPARRPAPPTQSRPAEAEAAARAEIAALRTRTAGAR